jgi:2-dehydropantoate 2-reductase
MHIAVLGVGGIGGYYAGVLARAGHNVSLLARGDNLVALQQRGIEVHTSEESFTTQVQASDDVARFGSVDFAIVSVKTYSLPQIAPAVAILANTGALILPLLNGVDIAERLIEHGVPEQSVLGGLTTVSAKRTKPGVFERHGKIQRVVLGELASLTPAGAKGQARQHRLRAIAEAFREAGVETEVSSDIRTDLWRKFAFLAPVAAACGLTRSPIGPIRSTPLGRLLLERAIREVIAVGRARAISLSDDDVSHVLEFCDTLPDSNKPSLLRDLEAGRNTEIEDLSGAVSGMARILEIETPIHDTATVAIRLASADHKRPGTDSLGVTHANWLSNIV